MGALISLILIGIGPKGFDEMVFALENFPKALIGYLSGTISCPILYDMSEVKNKVWYILMVISTFGLLFVTFLFFIIESPVLKIFFVLFILMLIISFYLRSVDHSINSNNC